MFEKLKPYTKTIIAFIVGILQIVALYVTLNNDGKLSSEDTNALIAAVIVALGGTGAVYQFPNTESQK